MSKAQQEAESAHGRSLLCIDGVELSFLRRGQGPALVCLHAVGHDAEDFSALTERFADRYELIALDWPGHGQSGPDARPVSAARYGALLIALLDQLGIERPIVIGNSIGGAAAIHYAKARPVRSLVLCDSGGLIAIDPVVRLFCALFAAFFAGGARGASWFAWAYGLYYRHVVLPSAAAETRRAQIIARGPELAPLLRDAWRSFARPDADLRAQLESLRVPIWFAWAARDRVIPYARVKACIARCASGQVSLFDAGHSAFLECPEAFAEDLARFIAGEALVSSNRSAAHESRAMRA
jgi:4,5:9,10-diseco-3-hydroxy-5,9,17-trioxoandrosta-1(10),2-diene-4-oate hydrolase